MIKNIIELSSFYKINSPIFEDYIENIYNSLCFLIKDYPNFPSWFYTKVYPELKIGNREILLYKIENELAGIAILKDSDEKKICNIRVSPKYQRNGIGKMLFEKSFEILDTSKPVITVSESRQIEFNSIFNYYGFELNEINQGLYLPKKKELVFNGTLLKDLTYKSAVI